MSMTKAMLLCGLALALCGVQAGELYKWTDAQGKVHFSDKPPKPSVATAKTVEVKVQPVTEAQRQEAQARLARLKAIADQPPAGRHRARRDDPARRAPASRPHGWHGL
ncbi:DUF4124 domain-containing protein [Ideonella paludis]|uniref:DUF4124 domain-containing protein n=1 Tax=Ideonella paludis TaxID=1233411 RepID=UPI00363C0509